MTTTAKTYVNRDAATRVLRGLGMKSDVYAKHLERVEGGKFKLVNLPTKAPAVTVAAEPKPAAKVTAPKAEPKAPRVTVASTARELIKAGKTNEEVFAVLQKQFKLDDSKKHYPSWYRSALKRAES